VILKILYRAPKSQSIRYIHASPVGDVVKYWFSWNRPAVDWWIYR